MKSAVIKSFLLFFCIILWDNIDAQPINKLKEWLRNESSVRKPFSEMEFSNGIVTKQQAVEASTLILEDFKKQMRSALDSSWKNKELKIGDHSLKFDYKIFGQKPIDGRSLFISMHGGGNAPPRVNDQQWKNQIGLYKPDEGVYLAPRAPTNTWNLWHEAHIDSLFDVLIQAAVLFADVNINKVYLMGYSAGGDGVYQLAPRMADRFAAASMMAGHPNETSPLGLRNLPFTIHMGALDSAYKRNEIARRWSVVLDSLQQQDKGGYIHFVQLHPGRAHWMNREDTVAIPWMQAFKRNPIPAKIVWKQDDVNHTDFYWLGTPLHAVKTSGEVIVSYHGNKINVISNYADTLLIYLNDEMLNLDKAVTVKYLGKKIYKGRVQRKLSTIYKTIEARKDAGLIFPASITIAHGKVITESSEQH